MRKDISMSFSYKYYYPQNVSRITKMIVRNNTSIFGLTATAIVVGAIITIASIMTLISGVNAQDDSDDDAIIIAAPATPAADPNTCVQGIDCPPECPEGFVPSSPTFTKNMFLEQGGGVPIERGCVPEMVASEFGVRSGEDESVIQGESAAGGENEDIGSTLSALPSNEDSSDSRDDSDEDDVEEGEGNDANNDGSPLRFGDGERGKRPPPSN